LLIAMMETTRKALGGTTTQLGKPIIMKTQCSCLLLTSIFTIGLAVQGRCDTNATVKITPVGLRVVAAGFGDEQPRPFNYPSKMEIALLIESADKPIVNISGKDCILTRLTDNRGTDLSSTRSSFSLNAEISSDGKRSILEISSAPPAHGATEITTSGQITFLVGKKSKIYEAKDAPLVKGPIAVEGLKASIGEVGKTPWGPAGTRLKLRIDGRASSLLEHVAFLDKDGKPMSAKFEGLGSASYTSGDNYDGTFRELYYILPPDTKTATLQFGVWDETESLKVPFEFITGLGL
jgi:hypothetical protein